MTRYARTQSPMTRKAVVMLMRYAGAFNAAMERGDWVTAADYATSCDDAREAIRASWKENNVLHGM